MILAISGKGTKEFIEVYVPILVEIWTYLSKNQTIDDFYAIFKYLLILALEPMIFTKESECTYNHFANISATKARIFMKF